MSVYTSLTPEETNYFLRDFDVGHLIRLEEIQDGVVNSNFRVDTSQGQFVLTLTEDPDQGQGLSDTCALLDYLAHKGVPCPRPIVNRVGQMIGQLKGHPALLATRLPGVSPVVPTPKQCRLVGEMLAKIHLFGKDFPKPRPNPMGPTTLQHLLQQLTPVYTDALIVDLLHKEMTHLLQPPQIDLPQGMCHTDLFPDNTLFQGEYLTGVIDFHYASFDRFVHDFAILLNAWGFQAGQPDPIRWRTLWQGYVHYRPLTKNEMFSMSWALRGAALRFALTRLTAQVFPRPGQTVTRKPPQEYLDRLVFYQNHDWQEVLGLFFD
ncbi:MAG: homoserine kinase [Magnetococcus sp. DMHC-6]